MKTKRIVSLFITLCMLMSLVPYTMVYAASTFSGGGGTEDNPYIISRAADLVTLANDVNGGNDYSGKYFELAGNLAGNIDLSTVCSRDLGDWTPIGTYTDDGDNTNDKPFKGIFNGAGNKITGLHNDTAANYLGLFGYVGEGGVIKNLGVKGVVSGLNNTAGIAAKNEGTIDGCYMTGNDSELVQGGAGSNTGGIVGENSGTVRNCYNDTRVQGNNNVGGIVGINKNGGIVENCYNKFEVGGGFGEVYAGGIVGENLGTVRNCYNAANVEGNDNVGGIVGNNNGGTVEYCYSKGYNIKSDGKVGGIVGTGDECTNCYYLKTSGFSGTLNTADGATVVNEENFKEFKDKTLFDGWDFENTWEINLFLQRPILCSNSEFTYDIDGEGTKDNPFLIPDLETLEMLQYYANDYIDRNTFENVYFKMTKDIDMSGNYSNESGKSWNPIDNWAAFCGIFDGGGHKITGLYINNPYNDQQGLFGIVGEGGVIKNLSVSGEVTTNRNNVGGIVGYSKGTITNCYNTCTVSGSDYVGGIVGYNYGGKITNCYNTGEVSGNSYFGGVCKKNDGGTITNCYYLANSDDGNGGKTTAQFASGEITHLLQSAQTAAAEGDPIPQVWGQTLNADTYPVLTSDANKKVYKVTFATQSNPTYAVKYANPNGTVALPTAPTAAYGYAFYKWSTSDTDYSNAANDFTASTEVTADITVYAVQQEKYGATVDTKNVTTTYGTEKTQNLSEYSVFASYTPASGTTSENKFNYEITQIRVNDTVITDTTEINKIATISNDTLTIPSTAAAGTYTLTIKATEKTPEVSLMSVDLGTVPITFDVAVTIAKANSSVTNEPTAKTLTYTGEAQALVTAGTATGGTMKYSLDNSTWLPNIPTGIDAKDYTVYYKVVGDSNHNETTPQSVTVKIAALAENTPNISIDYENETLTGFENGSSYTIDTAAVEPTNGSLAVESYMGSEISIVKKASDTNHKDSTPQTLTIPSRLSRPTLTIDNSTEQVTIPTGYLYGNVDANYTNITEPGSGEGVTVEPNASIYIYKPAVTEGENKGFKSEVQTLTAPDRITAPKEDNFTVTQPSTIGGTGRIEGITSDMEYSTDNGNTWNDGGATIEYIEGDTKYLIRYKDNDNNFKSDSCEIIINTYDPSKEATPNISIDYANETLTGFDTNGSYTIGGNSVTPTDGTLAAESYMGQTISIVKKGNGSTTNDSEPQTLKVPSRLSRPTLTIDNSTEKVTIPTGHLYGNVDANYDNITTQGTGEGVTVAPNASIYIYKAAVTEGENKGFKSEVQTLTAPDRITAPKEDNFTVKQPSTIGDTGSIEGITSDMEYSTDNGNTWNDGGATIEYIEGDTKYLIRYKESDNKFKSDSYEIIINAFAGTQETKPNIVIDYANEILTGFEADGNYEINGRAVTPTDGKLSIADYIGKTISIVKKGNGSTTNDSEPQRFEIPSRPTTPTGIKAGYNTITGVTNKMEYKLLADSNWTTVTGTTITGLLAEKYDVRIAATDSSFASEIVTVTVKEKSNSGSSFGGSSTANNYAVIVKTGKGGSASSSKVRVTAGDSVTITSVPDDGYKIDRITVNGTYYGNEEITTIASVNEDITVLVTFAKTSTEEKTGTEDWVNPFDDVKESDWFYENVKWVNKNGLMNGTSKNMFSPKADVTRGMFVTVLYRIEGEPQVSGVSRFTDVNSAAYYSKAVIWAESNGIVKGYTDTEFAPDDSVLREQIAAILYRYAAYKGYNVSASADITSYNDCGDISEYALEAVKWAVGMGIISGNPDNTIAPLNNATRAEIAAMIQRFIEANK